MLSIYLNAKMLVLVTGFCLLLVACLAPTEAQAETHLVIFQSVDVVNMFAAELTDTPVSVINTSQNSYGSNANEHIIWNIGFHWSDKFLGMDMFLWADVLEEFMSIISQISQE